LPEGVIEVVNYDASNSNTVDFKITQMWLDGSVSWIQPVYKKGTDDKKEALKKNQEITFAATCERGTALVDLFVVQDETTFATVMVGKRMLVLLIISLRLLVRAGPCREEDIGVA
jgi:hypothetical protein